MKRQQNERLVIFNSGNSTRMASIAVHMNERRMKSLLVFCILITIICNYNKVNYRCIN